MPDATAPVAATAVEEQAPEAVTSAPIVPPHEHAVAEERQEAFIAAPAVPEEKMSAVETQPAAITGEYVREIVAPEPEASRQAAPVPPVSLQLDWSSGLTQIETDAQKLQAALAKTREEQPVPRAKRERPPLPPVNNEPLVQVETHKAGDAAVAQEPATTAG
jgi:ribonuclease E